jgi:CRP/FNR family transcriptional regulator
MKPLKMTLAGISRPIPDITTFVTPIFADKTGTVYTQLIDEGTIAGFEQVLIDEEFQPLPLRTPVRIGDPALFAFELRNGEFLIGARRQLALLLDRWICNDNPHARYGSATISAIHRFLSGTIQADAPINSDIAPVFVARRSPVHQRWSMKRIDAKWIDAQRLAMPRAAQNFAEGAAVKHPTADPSRHAIPHAMGKNNGPSKSGSSSLHDIGVSLGVHIADTIDAQKILLEHLRMRAGERVYSNGQRLDCLYVVHSGFLKTVAPGPNGAGEVVRFPMQGDILGTSGIHLRRYDADTLALSDCELAIFPIHLLIAHIRPHRHMGEFMYKMACRDRHWETRRNDLIALKCPEARLALFLFYLSKRFHAMGHLDNHFQLHMANDDIASYLNLPVETVSERLVDFNRRGLIKLHGRAGEIVTPGGLHRICQDASPVDIFKGRPNEIDY